MGVDYTLQRIADAGRETGLDGELVALLPTYERTLRALEEVDETGVAVVADWIVERIRAHHSVPSARAVRRRAATFCRNNGYTVPDDTWICP